MAQVLLPQYTPRGYQKKNLWEPFDRGFKRIVQIWHRRSGKDITDLNLVSREMYKVVGNYYYLFPTYSQGRKALWDGRGKDGKRYIEYFPKALVTGTNDHEMKLRYKNGSLFQVIGVEDVDKIVGTNPRGLIFSEYSLQNPKAWEYLRPILAENKGWAIFNYTPRGRNHGYKLYEMARKNVKWFVSLLTVDDTDVLSKEDIEEERQSGMSEDMIQQEFYCSFIAAIQGSVYWNEIAQAEKNNRFKQIPHDPKLHVHTVWDLGKNNHNCIGFYQSNGMTVRKINYLSGQGKGLPDWISEVQRLGQQNGYVFGRHFGPHDIEVSDYSTSGDTSRKDIARELGFEFEVVPRVSIEEGIDAGRRFWKKLWVDEKNCEEFLEAIPQYQYEYDEEHKTFKKAPLHDWTSNFADEHRYAAIVNERFDNDQNDRIIEVMNTRRERESAKADSGL